MNEMEDDYFLTNNLEFSRNISLDMKTLTVMGHSLGGLTAIATAAKDKRIKATCAVDAWFYPYATCLGEIVVKDTPFLHQESSRYFESLSDSKSNFDMKVTADNYFSLVK